MRLQRMLHKATNDRDFGDLQARLEAAEPLWRAKGEMLGAEVSAFSSLHCDWPLVTNVGRLNVTVAVFRLRRNQASGFARMYVFLRELTF